MGRNPTLRRSGSTAVIAMVFLILFSLLAVGFFYGVTASVQVSKNEERVGRAQMAAESGLHFLRYHLATLDIPAGTSQADMAAEIAADLGAKLNATANLGQQTVTRSGNVITIPAIAADTTSGSAANFTAALEWVPVASPGTSYLRATVTGLSGSGTSQVTRAIRLDYGIQSKGTTVFDFGIASKGAVTIKSSPSTQVLGTPDAAGSILSASSSGTSISTGKGTIDGNLAVVVSKSQVSLGGGSVGGTTNTQLINEQHISVVPTPSFPVVDTLPFKQYATNVYTGAGYQKNIRVPPNTNPRFNGGDVIDGILYIESPNNVTFRGNATINGIIVFENKNTPASNSLDFRGNVSPLSIPSTPEFAALKAAANGWAILAPTASLVMSGSVDGFVTGTVMAQRIAFAGSADLTVTNGSVISLGSDVTDISGKIVHIKGTAANNPPTTGLTFSGRFVPDPSSYYEPQ